MAKRQRTGASRKTDALDLSHLRRETRTALELAVVALAPSELIEPLARAAGLLEAITELPTDSVPVIALIPGLVRGANSALQGWNAWHQAYLEKKIPRG